MDVNTSANLALTLEEKPSLFFWYIEYHLEYHEVSSSWGKEDNGPVSPSDGSVYLPEKGDQLLTIGPIAILQLYGGIGGELCVICWVVVHGDWFESQSSGKDGSLYLLENLTEARRFEGGPYYHADLLVGEEDDEACTLSWILAGSIFSPSFSILWESVSSPSSSRTPRPWSRFTCCRSTALFLAVCFPPRFLF